MAGTDRLRAAAEDPGKLRVAFLLIGIGVVGVGAFVIHDVQTAHQATLEMHAGLISALDVIAELQYQSQQTRLSALLALTATDASQRIGFAEESRAAARRVSEMISEYLRIAGSPEAVAAGQTLEAHWKTYLRVRDETLDAILAGNIRKASERSQSQGIPRFNQVRDDIQSVKQLYETQAGNLLIEVGGASSRSLWKLAFALGLTIFFAGLAINQLQKGHMLQAVQRSEAVLRSFYESAPMMMGIVEVEGEAIRHISDNHAAATFFGLTPDAMRNRTANELGVPLEHIREWVGHYRESAESRGPVRFEYRHESPAGGRWLSGIVAPLALASSGPPRFSYIVEDVTKRKETEQALNRERDLFNALMDNIPDMIYFEDTNLRFTKINQAQATSLGVAHPRDAIGKTDFDFFPKEQAQEFSVSEKKLIASGQPVINSLEEIRRPGEKTRWLSASKVPIRDKQGQVIGLVGISRDVTEHRRAEQRLAVQHAATRVLAESATLHDATPQILRAICEGLNWEAADLWEVDAEAQVLRRGNFWHIPSANAAEFEKATREVTFKPGVGLPGRVWQTAQPAWIPDVLKDNNFPRAPLAAQAGLHGAFACPILAARQVIGVLELFSFRIQQPDEELLRVFAAIGSQIGQFIERKRAEEVVELLSYQNELILHSAGEGIYRVDPDGKATFVNPAAVAILGWKIEELIGQPQHTLLHHTKADGTPYPEEECPIHKSLRDGETYRVDDEVFWRKDGSSFPVEYVSAPIRERRKIAGAVVMFSDISKRKQAERELKSALQMKSDFVSFATHQLRTPLAGIKWSLELAAQEEGVPPETASFIQDARDSAQRLIGMVNDLLDVSRLETGKLVLQPKPTSLAELTETVLKDVSHQIRKQGHQLSVARAEGLSAVLVDPQLFRQVILNLVSNAIKYTPPGGKIDIRITQENGLASWEIRDSGIGIPKASQARLFEKFYRAENVYKVETEGTGLGLHLVKMIVEKSGGHICCESEENQGSAFTFTLPLGGGK